MTHGAARDRRRGRRQEAGRRHAHWLLYAEQRAREGGRLSRRHAGEPGKLLPVASSLRQGRDNRVTEWQRGPSTSASQSHLSGATVTLCPSPHTALSAPFPVSTVSTGRGLDYGAFPELDTAELRKPDHSEA